MAENPRVNLPASTGDVPGLDTALAGKAGIVGASRIVVVRIGDPEPDLVEGDIVLREGPPANRAPAAFTPTVASVTHNSATVTFATTDPDGDSLTYKVAITTSATAPTDWSGYSVQTSPYSASTLTPETTLYAHVQASDGLGGLRVGTSASFTTDAAPVENQPPAAFTPTVSLVTHDSARVTFSTTDHESNPLTYRLAVTTSATAPVDWSGYSDVTSPQDVTGLSGSTTYYAHVRASDGTLATIGSSTSFATEATPDTTAPSLSGTLTANPGDGQVALDWPDATDAVGVTRYVVEHSANSDYSSATTVNVDGTPPTSAVTITGLTNAALRYFRVKAQDAATNESGYLTASATPAAAYAIVTDNLLVSLQAAKAYNGMPNSNADATNRAKFNDLTANAVNGTVTGATWTTTSGWAGDGSGGNPYAINLTAATDDFVSLGDHATLGRVTTTTLEVWLKFNSTIATQADTVDFICGKGGVGDGVGAYGIYTYKTNGDLRVYMNSAGSGNVASGGTITAENLASIDNGGWHHLVFVLIPGSTPKCYIDGSAVAVDTTGWNNSGTPIDNEMPFILFNCNSVPTATQNWQGSIAAFRMYGDELTAGEVAYNYAAGISAS